MKRALAIILASTALASEPSQDYFNKLADAIWWSEGGTKASVPYGIKSVKVKDAKEARAVCIRTCKRAHALWRKTERKMDFITFLSDAYCPAKSDPVGHKNWIHNVRYFMRKPKPINQ